MRTLVLLVFVSREECDGGEYAYVSLIEEPERMRRALLGFLSLAVSHKNMDEYEWKGKLLSREQRGWFSSIRRAWVSNSRRPK
ncbi:uncharacterized protein TrAtP1_009807 [Trichoderma atroviride]|uniref:uncharacterized protein n=1 Tax=Hypocrea atroviridis TaxID=63577 RepID=UPI00331FEFF7|nr:hypothetical protein TrAtP1_009807 [Trichoderma atroviride]